MNPDTREVSKTIVYQKVGRKRKRRIVKKLVQKEDLKRLMREDNFIFHARTKDLIIGVSLLERKKPPSRKKKPHLSRFPRIPYHTHINAKLVNGKFIIIPLEKALDDNNKILPQYQDFKAIQQNGKVALIKFVGSGKEPEFKPTKQYKTVWFTKHQRRQ